MSRCDDLRLQALSESFILTNKIKQMEQSGKKDIHCFVKYNFSDYNICVPNDEESALMVRRFTEKFNKERIVFIYYIEDTEYAFDIPRLEHPICVNCFYKNVKVNIVKEIGPPQPQFVFGEKSAGTFIKSKETVYETLAETDFARGRFTCQGCFYNTYCSKECQLEHWPRHKKLCPQLKKVCRVCIKPAVIECSCKKVKFCSESCQSDYKFHHDH